MTWTGERKHHLPRNWPTTRKTVIQRDPVCTCTGCPRCTGVGCTRASTDADHVIPGDNHQMHNLAGKCRECHRWKSAQEGIQARGDGSLRRRPPERHPGNITAGGG